MPATSPSLRTRAWAAIATADAAAWLLLAAAVMGAAYAYTSHERCLYFWDWAGSHAVAADFTELLMAEPRAGLELGPTASVGPTSSAAHSAAPCVLTP
ncbi:hypothetical protein KJ059_08375 [Myxococcota bacterium]|nr:hypothetical protein [Myxococcota bacterium]MCZ7619940.1 hypothetical protein [Myxococcota bacterium]